MNNWDIETFKAYTTGERLYRIYLTGKLKARELTNFEYASYISYKLMKESNRV